MNKAQRPTVEEAIRIGKVSMEFSEAYGFLRAMMNVYQCHPIDSDNEWNLVCMLFDIYNAGRIYGIRQERQKKK